MVCQRVLSTAKPGQIVLMHVGANPDDGTTIDATALPCIVEGLRAKGYGFVESMTYAVGVAAGFTLSLLLIAGLRERIKIAPIPDFLKGTPILFVAAALLVTLDDRINR